MTRIAAVAVILALSLDAVFAEPPRRAHPVVWFGEAVSRADRTWTRPKLVGLLLAAALPVCAAAIAVGSIRTLSALISPAPAVIGIGLVGTLTAGWLFVTTSRHMLVDRATAVLDAASADPSRAKEAAAALVGRETHSLTPAELRGAAVESSAENLGDGLVAPLLAFVIGAQFSVALGAGAAVWVKAVNTLDSMLGYPEKPHGAASATLDDLVNWLPARLSAVLLAVVALDPCAPRRGAAWAGRPASPNSGWPMATLAAIIDSRLTKSAEYTLNDRAKLPTDERARRGVRMVDRASLLSFLLAGVAVWF